jgi:hypothetical protein
MTDTGVMGHPGQMGGAPTGRPQQQVMVVTPQATSMTSPQGAQQLQQQGHMQSQQVSNLCTKC